MAKEAAFWSACDAETLTLESPTEAIHEYLDSMYDPKADILTTIARCCPLTVTGFAPVDVDERWITSLAANAVERFVEHVEEEYGHPNGDVQQVTDEKRDALEVAVRTAFLAAVKDLRPWLCKKVESRTYTAEDVEAILRADCPEWFGEGE